MICVCCVLFIGARSPWCNSHDWRGGQKTGCLSTCINGTASRYVPVRILMWLARKYPSILARLSFEFAPIYDCASKDLKCWGAWDTTCGHKAKDIASSIAWGREALKEEALDDLPWKDEREPSSIRRTLELFQRQRWGNVWEMGFKKYILCVCVYACVCVCVIICGQYVVPFVCCLFCLCKKCS